MAVSSGGEFILTYVSQYSTTPNTVYRSYDATYTFTAEDLPTLSCTGYNFLGWTTIEGSMTAITVGNVITPKPYQTYTLYAIWEERTIQIEINRLNEAKADIQMAIIESGIDVPDEATLDEYGDLVRQITSTKVQTGTANLTTDTAQTYTFLGLKFQPSRIIIFNTYYMANMTSDNNYSTLIALDSKSGDDATLVKAWAYCGKYDYYYPVMQESTADSLTSITLGSNSFTIDLSTMNFLWKKNSGSSYNVYFPRQFSWIAIG